MVYFVATSVCETRGNGNEKFICRRGRLEQSQISMSFGFHEAVCFQLALSFTLLLLSNWTVSSFHDFPNFNMFFSTSLELLLSLLEHHKAFLRVSLKVYWSITILFKALEVEWGKCWLQAADGKKTQHKFPCERANVNTSIFTQAVEAMWQISAMWQQPPFNKGDSQTENCSKTAMQKPPEGGF